jgi:hypothetical protein
VQSYDEDVEANEEAAIEEANEEAAIEMFAKLTTPRQRTSSRVYSADINNQDSLTEEAFASTPMPRQRLSSRVYSPETNIQGIV